MALAGDAPAVARGTSISHACLRRRGLNGKDERPSAWRVHGSGHWETSMKLKILAIVALAVVGVGAAFVALGGLPASAAHDDPTT